MFNELSKTFLKVFTVVVCVKVSEKLIELGADAAASGLVFARQKIAKRKAA